MKKYIIAAATIMAINNSPTFAREFVKNLGQQRTEYGGGLADKGAEISSAIEKEQGSVSTQGTGDALSNTRPRWNVGSEMQRPYAKPSDELTAEQKYWENVFHMIDTKEQKDNQDGRQPGVPTRVR